MKGIGGNTRQNERWFSMNGGYVLYDCVELVVAFLYAFCASSLAFSALRWDDLDPFVNEPIVLDVGIDELLVCLLSLVAFAVASPRSPRPFFSPAWTAPHDERPDRPLEPSPTTPSTLTVFLMKGLGKLASSFKSYTGGGGAVQGALIFVGNGGTGGGAVAA